MAARASAPSRPGAVKMTWWQAGDALVLGVDRAVLVLDRGHHARARVDQLAARARGRPASPSVAASTIA